MRWTRHDTRTGIDSRFSSLFLSYYDDVLGYCVRRTNRSEGEDAAAEVFATAWRRIDDLEWDTARPWLFGIARGVLSNHRRSGSRRRRLSQKVGSLGETQVEGPEVVVIRREQDQQVMDVLDGLRDNDREILMLSTWEELTASEIATVLGISVSATEQRLHRARKRFAIALEHISAQVSPRAAIEGGHS
jgi:RNA polymerase sigma-70 factor (ECF subfamily)